MKSFFLILVFFSLCKVNAQIHEVGFFLGGSNYVGDIGSTNYLLPNKFAGGIVYKYNLNPRIALRGNYTYIPISGNDDNASNPYRKTLNRDFNNTINEYALGIEFNFLNYNIDELATSFTPYIMTQMALFSYKEPAGFNKKVILKNATSFTIPVGVGIKGKLYKDFAYAVEIGVRYSFTDKLDYSAKEIPVLDFEGNGNDWYMFSGISIVYTFGRPPCFAPIN